jgi:hypothetical protein
VLVEDLRRKTDPKMTAALDPLIPLMPMRMLMMLLSQQTQRQVPEEQVIAHVLFDAKQIYEPRRAARLEAVMPQQLGQAPFEWPYDVKEALWWMTEDHPARTPKSLSEEGVREKVVQAWKMDRARALARKEAQELANEITAKARDEKNKWTSADSQKMLREKKAAVAGSGELFELENVARLATPAQPLMKGQDLLAPMGYERYRVPDYKKRLMPWEPPDLADKLLALRQEGRAAVIADVPEDTYYVAVLLAWVPPDLSAFERAYAGGSKRRTDQLYRMFLVQRTGEYKAAVMRQLREDAGKINKDGRFDVPEEFKRRSGESHDVD